MCPPPAGPAVGVQFRRPPKLFGALSTVLDKVHHRRAFLAYTLALVVFALCGIALSGLKVPQAIPYLSGIACLIVLFAGFVLRQDKPSRS
jgi:hypothetical protein